MTLKALFQVGLIFTSAITLAIVSYPHTATQIQAQSATTPANLPKLQLGMRGEAVRILQIKLKERGVYRDRITGNFDANTENAVKAAQAKYELPINGVVDTPTWFVLFYPPFKFASPSSAGAPGGRIYLGGRGVCPEVQKHLTALIPQRNIGLTISERPTFWFYVPYSANSKNPVEFVLVDEEENAVYKQTFQLTGTPGIVSISLPSNLPPLKEDKKYHWLFSFICDLQMRSHDLPVEGYVQRIALNPNLKSQLEEASTPRDKLLLYAENGLWYETITNLLDSRRKKPQDKQLRSDWEKLLKNKDVNLPALADSPVLNCCTQKEE